MTTAEEKAQEILCQSEVSAPYAQLKSLELLIARALEAAAAEEREACARLADAHAERAVADGWPEEASAATDIAGVIRVR